MGGSKNSQNRTGLRLQYVPTLIFAHNFTSELMCCPDFLLFLLYSTDKREDGVEVAAEHYAQSLCRLGAT